MIYKTGKPFVKVLNSHDYRMYAWFMSRDKTTVTNVRDLRNFNTSLQDLHEVVVHFNASAGFRELLTGLRPYAMWSQSSRNRDIKEIEIADYNGNSEKLEDTMEQVYAKSEEYDQDYGRMYLPLAHLGEFVYKAPLRLFFALYTSLQELAPQYLDIYLRPLFAQLGLNPEDYEYPAIHKEYELQSKFEEGTSRFNGMVTIAREINYGMRTHLVRQSRVNVRDMIWSHLGVLGVNKFESQNLMDPIHVVAMMSENAYAATAQKRACFIAQVDLWYMFIKDEYEKLGFPEILPCHGDKSKCTVKSEAEDAKIRKKYTLPCPIYEADRYYYDVRKANARYPEAYELMADFFDTQFIDF